ncbi:MAG: PDZ domain-containing protein [Gemmatimonadaceae bacterium]
MRTTLIISAATLLVAGNGFSQEKASPSMEDEGCTTYSDGRKECVRTRLRGPGDSLLTRHFFREDSAMMKRAALGLELRATGTRRDTLGVFIVAVTPRGPAETAGIVEGDRIASINGVDVRSVAADVDDPYTNGIASHRLSKEVQKLAPGARVTLRVYSGGRFRDVVVTAGRASEVLRHAGFNFRVPGPEGMGFGGPDGGMMFSPEIRMQLDRMVPELQKRLRSLPRKMEFRRLPRERLKVIELDDLLMDVDRSVAPIV